MSDLNLIRLYIEKKVFVTKEQKKIQPTNTEREEVSSWLFDFREICLTPDFLEAFTKIFLEKYKDRKIQVCGLEVAAIPLVSAIVLASKYKSQPINGFFVRKSRKKTGLMQMVEGNIQDGVDIVLIDDLINSGSSLHRLLEIMDGLNHKVTDVFTILRFRDLEFYTLFRERSIKMHSLFSLNDFTNSLGVVNLQKQIKLEPVLKPLPKVETLWYFAGKNPNYSYVVPKSTPAVDQEKVYFGTDDGTFYALDKKTGEVVWTYKVLFGVKHKYIFSAPAVYKNLVYFGAYDGNFYALYKDTGKVAWVNMDADWVGSSPAIAPDLGLVYIGMEYGMFKKKGGLTALNALTGQIAWKDETHTEYTHCSPAYSEKWNVVICGSNDKIVRIYNPKTGVVLDSITTEGEIKASFSFHPTLPLITFGSFDKKVYVYNLKEKKVLSVFETREIVYSTPTFYKDTVIATSLDKCIYCFEIATGNQTWIYNTGARVFASPIVYKDLVICGSNTSKLHFIHAATGEIQHYIQFVERITNKVVIENDTLYVLTFANEVYCIKNFIIK